MGPVDLLKQILDAIKSLQQKGPSGPSPASGTAPSSAPAKALAAQAAQARAVAQQAGAKHAAVRAQAAAAAAQLGPRSPQAKQARQQARHSAAHAAGRRAAAAQAAAAASQARAANQQAGARPGPKPVKRGTERPLSHPVHQLARGFGALGHYSGAAAEIGHAFGTVGTLLDVYEQFRSYVNPSPGGGRNSPAPGSPAIPTLQHAPPIPTLQLANQPPPPTGPAPPAPTGPLFPAGPGMPPAFGKSPPPAPKTPPAPAAPRSPPLAGPAPARGGGWEGAMKRATAARQAPQGAPPPPLQVNGAKSDQPYPGFHEVFDTPAPAAPGAGTPSSAARLTESLDSLLGDLKKLARLGKGPSPERSALTASSDRHLAESEKWGQKLSSEGGTMQAEQLFGWAMKAASTLVAAL
jgi:hypothetical protein